MVSVPKITKIKILKILIGLIAGVVATVALCDSGNELELTDADVDASLPVEVKVEKAIRVPFKVPMTSFVWSDDANYAFATAGTSTGYLIQVQTGTVKKVSFDGEGTPVERPPHAVFSRSPKSRKLVLLLLHGAYTSGPLERSTYAKMGVDEPISGVLTAWRIGQNIQKVGQLSWKHELWLLFAVGDPADPSLKESRFLREHETTLAVRHLATGNSERLPVLTELSLADAVVATKTTRIIRTAGGVVRCWDLGAGAKKWSFDVPDLPEGGFISQKYQAPLFVVLPKAKTLSYLYAEKRKGNCVLVTRDLSSGKVVTRVRLPWKYRSVALCSASPTRVALVTNEGLVYLLSPSAPKKMALLDLRGYLGGQSLITWHYSAGDFIDPGIHFSVDGQKAAFVDHKGVLRIVRLQEKRATSQTAE